MRVFGRGTNAGAEFLQICRAVGTGFVVMGFIGYLVKLIHIPINNIVRWDGLWSDHWALTTRLRACCRCRFI